MRSFNRCVHALLVLCVWSLGASTSRAEEWRTAIPKASVHFDDQIMRLAYATSNDTMTLMEFIPDGQTLDYWTSLAALYVYQNAPLGPQKRAEVFAAQIKKSNEEKGLECFRAISPKRAPTTESAQ